MIAFIITSIIVLVVIGLAIRKLYLVHQQDIKSMPDIWSDDDDDEKTPVETPTPEKLARRKNQINQMLRDYSEAIEISKKISLK